MSIQINVTEEHIQKAVRAVIYSCPVARAVHEATGELAIVGPSSIVVFREEHVMPEIVRKFVSDFDDGEPVSPFTFELPIDPISR